VDYGAIDVHKQDSQIRIVAGTGEVVDRRVRTTVEGLTGVFGGRPRTRVLVEASTESQWVAEHLEGLGHEVIVADPNYAPMYGMRSRRIKTDLRDTAALAEACRQGTYRVVHRRSMPHRHWQWELAVRDQLVRTRTRAINTLRALTRGVGARVPSVASERLVAAVGAMALPEALRDRLGPLCDLIAHTTTALGAQELRLARLAAADVVCSRLMTAPGVGPLTAVAFVAALDDPHRFHTASQVAQYLGLVPHEQSSGETQRRGRVVRSAQPRVQQLLVQAAWRVLRMSGRDAAGLRGWGLAIAARRGRRRAAVAVARRLARILWAMWRDGTAFRAPTPPTVEE
jgi:transposase